MPRANHYQVNYAVSFLDTRNNHPDMPQKQTGNTNPAEWVSDLHEAKDLYLDVFELFANKLHTMYEDNHR
jgi:hypothetical protein